MITRTIFETEHEQFRDSVAKFLESEAVPFYAQWEKDGQIDRSLWLKAGEQGYLCPSIPEEYGGVGGDYRYNSILVEECERLGLSSVGIGFGVHSDIAVPYILDYGSDAIKQKYLPKCLSGEIVTAIAITEPQTGSDIQNIKTRADINGAEYVINGSKTFITNGQQADLIIVVCKTDVGAAADGISLLLVEAETPGFKKGANLEKIGLKAQDTSELFFQDVRVPEENLLGEEGQGFAYLMQKLPQERMSIAIIALAAAESILQQTLHYVKDRKAFGEPVAAFQNTQFKLAELDTEVTCARVFIDKCIELLVRNELDTVTASKAKLLSSELQGRVVDECLQLHGGYGYMWEYPVARAYADARVQRIYGGTSEVMKLIISRALLS